MNKKTILHSVGIMNRAGQETLLMNIYRNVNRELITFHFLCSRNEEGDYDQEIYRLGGSIQHLKKSKYSNIRYIQYIAQFASFYDFFRKNKHYSIYHIHSYHAFDCAIQFFAAKLFGIKNIIIHSHNSNGPQRNLHFIFRFILNRFSIIRFACSDQAGKWMFGKKPYKVIHNAINLENFSYNENYNKKKREELGLNSDELIIGHIGRFEYQKNHSFLIDVFIEVVKIYKNSTLLLVGTGDLQGEIQRKVNQNSISNKVIFAGVREDIPEVLSAMDIMVFPSHFEGLSLVLIEVQANGLFTIVSDSISSETFLTPTIKAISLNKSAAYWANEVIESIGKRKKNMDNILLLKSAGYSIKDMAIDLQQFYLDL